MRDAEDSGAQPLCHLSPATSPPAFPPLNPPALSPSSYPSSVNDALLSTSMKTLEVMQEVLHSMKALEACSVRQDVHSTAIAERMSLEQTETNLRIEAAVETLNRTMPHYIQNAITKANTEMLSMNYSRNIEVRVQKMERLRAKLCVAEELAVNAMKEEKRKGALIQNLLIENAYLRESLLSGNPPVPVPPQSEVLAREAEISMKHTLSSIKQKKLKKLKLQKKEYKLRLLSEVSSDSEEEDPEDKSLAEYASDSDEDILDGVHNFRSLLKHYRRNEKEIFASEEGAKEAQNQDISGAGQSEQNISRSSDAGSSDPSGKGKGKMDDA
jgi:hypothetical protein